MERSKSNNNHKYLLNLYSRVNEFLGEESINNDDVPEVIVSFCTAVEKILKIKLYNINPVLPYDTSGSIVKQDDLLPAIVLKKENNSLQTLKIESIIKRVEIIFEDEFTSGELQILNDIYKLRSCFIHGCKSDNEVEYEVDEIVRKMGTFWPKISKIAEALFGADKIKSASPKKMYSEKELEKVLEDDVKKMIHSSKMEQPLYGHNLDGDMFTPELTYGDKCPRCGSGLFSMISENRSWATMYDSIGTFTASPEFATGLYKCKKCNLELTEKQYEIAKKITKSNDSINQW